VSVRHARVCPNATESDDPIYGDNDAATALACCSFKVPTIWRSPEYDVDTNAGADSTTPLTTIATELPGGSLLPNREAKWLSCFVPSRLRPTVTTHPVPGSRSARALVTTVPVVAAGPTA
jgi:hypothetical protein